MYTAGWKQSNPMCSSLFKDQKPKHFHDLLFEDFFSFFPHRSNILRYVTISSYLGHSSCRVNVALLFRGIISHNALLTASVRRYSLLELGSCVLRNNKFRLHPISWRDSFFISFIIPCSKLCLYSCITFLYFH